MRYAAELEGAGSARRHPPVEKWDPPYCGELNLVIRRDGVWVHEGSPIGRAALVRLFSTVLRREGGRYFLVTPVEKLGVVVEDAPFLAVLMRVEGAGTSQRLTFTTNVGDEATAGPGHELVVRPNPAGESAPYIHIRAGLWAKVARPVYYDLVALGEPRDCEGGVRFGVYSLGVFFPLGSATDAQLFG
ncbi:MAG: DUF1285 domain-containing protein [Parvularculaceae bacterium]|nr:DUF1285 domain-containing protein [Parvularculaceae bacterium]